MLHCGGMAHHNPDIARIMQRIKSAAEEIAFDEGLAKVKVFVDLDLSPRKVALIEIVEVVETNEIADGFVPIQLSEVN